MAIQYMQYVAKYGKSYLTTEEFAARQSLYAETNAMIMAHNETESSFKLGHNAFSDFTEHERSKLTGAKSYNHVASGTLPIPDDLAASVDWREKGGVTPVKN